MMGPMGGGPHRARMLEQETLKPQNVSRTLARFGRYFRPYWPALVVVAVLVIASTWTQVTTPDLTGQVVDCYLAPSAGGALAGFGATRRADLGPLRQQLLVCTRREPAHLHPAHVESGLQSGRISGTGRRTPPI